MSNSLKYELQLNTAEAEKQMNEFIEKGKKKLAEMEKTIGTKPSGGASNEQKKMEDLQKMIQNQYKQKQKLEAAYTEWWKQQLDDKAKKEQQVAEQQQQALDQQKKAEQKKMEDLQKMIQTQYKQKQKADQEYVDWWTQQLDAQQEAEDNAFNRKVKGHAKMLALMNKEEQAKNDAVDKLESKLHKDRLTNMKLEQEERDKMFTDYQQMLDKINAKSPNQSADQTKREVAALTEKYEIEKRMREQKSQAVIKSSTKEAKAIEQIDKKQYAAQRSLASAANRAYHVDQQKKIEITARAHQDIQHIVANSANQTVEDTRRQIQTVVDTTKQELAKLEMEAARQGGRGYGSFSNNMFQVGQAVEDFNVGFQLNGWLGGLRGASNNVALLLSQIEGVTGVIAQMGFMALVTGAQIAIFASDAEGAADATDEFTNKLIESRFGFRQLTDEALNYRKEVISAITDTAMDGLEPFINTMDALEAKQKLAFKIEDAKQYADEIGRTATKLRDLVRAEKDLQVAQAEAADLLLNASALPGDPIDFERTIKGEMLIQKAQEALTKRQEEYMRLAKELDLPELNAQLREYAELETLLAQSTVENIEEKQARYEELRQTMLATFEKARKEREQEIEDERQRAALIEQTAANVRNQAAAIQELVDSEAGRSASKEVDEILSVGKYKEIQSLRTILKLQEELDHAEGDQKRKIQSEIIKHQKQIVDNYDIQLEVIGNIVDKEEDRLDAIKLMQRAADQAVDTGKNRLNQLKQEIRDEDQKLETYKKQLLTLQQQAHAHKVGGKLGFIGGQETLMNTEAGNLIQNIQNQAEAHKKFVQAQVEAQNQLANAFGGVGVNADAYLQFVDAKAEWLINQVKAKQKEYTFLFNKQREEELKRESDFQMKMSAIAGTPEEKIAAIERAIKAQEDLRQLQLSQVSEGGQFGMDKLKQSEQTGQKIEAMYIKQAMLLKEASLEAEKQKQIKEQEAMILEQNLLRLDELKKALADKDIISEMDVARAQQIEQAMLRINAAMQATGLGGAAEGINILGKGLGLPGFANGGVFDGKGPILVGEKGPEIIFPQSSGLVLTNQESQRLMSTLWASQSFGGGGSTTNVSTNIGTVNIQGPPVSTGNNLATQLRNSRYAARTRKR